MSRKATRPLDDAAVAAANDEFYRRHPEMIVDGERVPLDARSARHAPMREEWMDLYVAHGGEVESANPPPDTPDGPEPVCPERCGDLAVSVTSHEGDPLQGYRLEISGPESRAGTTTADGSRLFSALPIGSYSVSCSHEHVEAQFQDAEVTEQTTTALEFQFQISSDAPLPTIHGRFAEEQCRCGDATHVEAEATELADGEEVRFDIIDAADGRTVLSFPATVSGSRVPATSWEARAPSANTGSTYRLRMIHPRVEADGENEFAFEPWPAYGRERQSWRCTSGVYGWDAKFDIEFDGARVEVRVRIKLINRLGAKPAPGDPMPDAGDPVSDVDKAAMKADVEGKLSGKIHLTRTACRYGDDCSCRLPIRVVVSFVEDDYHHEVNFAPRRGAGKRVELDTREDAGPQLGPRDGSPARVL